MSDAKYTVINKCFDNINIVALTILNSDGNTKLIKLSDAIKLARGDKLSNAHCILDTSTGEYMICINNGINNLESICKNNSLRLTLMCRIMSSNKCIGYKARDTNGKTYNLSIHKTWDLAINHNVNDVEAKVINGKKVLISKNNFELAKLPKMTQ